MSQIDAEIQARKWAAPHPQNTKKEGGKGDDSNEVGTLKVQVVVRLDVSQYKVLEKQFGKPVPRTDTTDIQAGYLLGVQDVLRAVRDGFTIGA